MSTYLNIVISIFCFRNSVSCRTNHEGMRSSLLLAILLIFCLHLSTVKGDACNFTVFFQYNTQNVVTVAPYAAVQSCFAAVPFSSSFRAQTLDVLYQLFTMYSFTDIVANSGAPRVGIFKSMCGRNWIESTRPFTLMAEWGTIHHKAAERHKAYARHKACWTRSEYQQPWRSHP